MSEYWELHKISKLVRKHSTGLLRLGRLQNWAWPQTGAPGTVCGGQRHSALCQAEILSAGISPTSGSLPPHPDHPASVLTGGRTPTCPRTPGCALLARGDHLEIGILIMANFFKAISVAICNEEQKHLTPSCVPAWYTRCSPRPSRVACRKPLLLLFL